MKLFIWNYYTCAGFNNEICTCISCKFSNKDFVSLGKQTRRCKQQLQTIAATIETNKQSLSPNTSLATQNSNNVLIIQVENTFDPHENEKQNTNLDVIVDANLILLEV